MSVAPVQAVQHMFVFLIASSGEIWLRLLLKTNHGTVCPLPNWSNIILLRLILFLEPVWCMSFQGGSCVMDQNQSVAHDGGSGPEADTVH